MRSRRRGLASPSRRAKAFGVPLFRKEPLREIDALLKLRQALLPSFQLPDAALEVLDTLRSVGEAVLVICRLGSDAPRQGEYQWAQHGTNCDEAYGISKAEHPYSFL
jgi:hypothetical protein